MGKFQLTDKQKEAQTVVAGNARNILFDGGSRSGKTFLHCRNIAMRALKAPGSRHAILRFRFNHCKQSIVLDTWPKMMRLCFPGVQETINRTDWFASLGDGSEIWFGGLDDKERTEKILGMEFATIYLVECSQITWESVQTVMTRLAQNCEQIIVRKDGTEYRSPLSLRMFYDCNPPSKAHWIYKLFYLHKQPSNGEPLARPDQYVSVKMNPKDNESNLPPEYFEVLEGLSERQRNRFLYGLYADATPGQLFSDDEIEKWRQMDDERIPDFVRVVVGVDPSGSDDEDNIENDAIGIVVGALGTDGRGYLLEDCTLKAGPGTWGKVAVNAWDRHDADCIVGEQNYGGAMVKYTIKTQDPSVPYRKVTATRGKSVRAEPFSSLYEQGKIRHVGRFPDLEEELTGYSTMGYLGSGSPNRADAWIWVLAELFPGMIKKTKKKEAKEASERKHAYSDFVPNGLGWMG